MEQKLRNDFNINLNTDLGLENQRNESEHEMNLMMLTLGEKDKKITH